MLIYGSKAAFSRKAVRELNDQARDRLQAKGEIGQENIVFQGFERGIQISTGDRLLFRENNKSLGLRNGDTGTVKCVNHNFFNIELDSGERLTVPKDYRAIDYGDALTVHKSQGMTAKQVQVLIDSKYWDRNLSYVAFTRHKEGLRIYTDKINYANKDELVKTLSRRSIMHNVIDWPLNLAVRCGLNPDKWLGKIINRLLDVQTTTTPKIPNHESGSDLSKGSELLSPEVNKIQQMLDKRKKLNGYFAERLDKEISLLGQQILKDKQQIIALTKLAPSIQESIQSASNLKKAKVIERSL